MKTIRRCSLLLFAFTSLFAAAQQTPEFPPGITDGCFVSLNLKTGVYFRIHEDVCQKRFSPYSTFKIPNSLIGLKTGVIKDPDKKWHWDAAKYPVPENAPGGDYKKIWAQDNSMRTALANSIVWYYREVATRVGEKRMEEWLHKFSYGNEDISGGIDQFWLRSSLLISPEEQVQFLTKLSRGKLPVSREHLAIVQEILIKEKGTDYKLMAKTGSSFGGEGWLVGWTEAPKGPCTFALHLKAGSFAEMAEMRKKLGRDFLKAAGCLPE
jgi:beta-lactamase class D